MVALRQLIPGLVLASLTLCCSAPGDAVPPAVREGGAGPNHLQPSSAAEALGPAPAQSAGLFVGNGASGDQTMVNDAVNLAYALAVEQRLLPLSKVSLLLSGDPSDAAAEKLSRMRGEASIERATRDRIEGALSRQAEAVGDSGTLYISFATHGFTFNEHQYLVAEDSADGNPATAVDADNLLRTAQAEARGQILFIQDACRVRYSEPQSANQAGALPTPLQSPLPLATDSATSRGGLPDLTRSFKVAMAQQRGTAVFFATGPDGKAWPESERERGVLTGAIIDALRCDSSSTQPKEIRLFSLVPAVQVAVRRTSERSGRPQSAQWLTSDGFHDLIMARCPPYCEILEPRPNDIVQVGNGVVRLRCIEHGLFATPVLFPEISNAYFLQSAVGAPTDNGILHLPVTYGGPGAFQVLVALTPDQEFFTGQTVIPQPPLKDGLGRPIYWLGPVPVTVAR